MKRVILSVLSFILFFIFLASCSGQEESESQQGSPTADSSSMEMNEAVEDGETSLSATENRLSEDARKSEEKEDIADVPESDLEVRASERKVIYNAELHLQVKNYVKAQEELESKAFKYGGYVVESTTNSHENEQLSGWLIFRIPQQHFTAFLRDTEDTASNIESRHVSGQDVTEEYVDLESRLRSKKAVETRLLDFMEDAKKTEDLLKISADLATIQEQIEQITGRMNYLENQISFSTVTISMEETDIQVPKIDQKDLDTWEKVKKQLAVNVNWLLAFLSGMIVLVAGNLPIVIVLGLITTMIVFILKKFRKRNRDAGPPAD